MLAYEKELLGFYVTGHPLTQHANILRRYELATTASLVELQEGTDTDAITRLQQRLSNSYFVKPESVTFVSREEATNLLRQLEITITKKPLTTWLKI